MTFTNPTFNIFAGERKDLEFPVSDMSDLTGFSFSFQLATNKANMQNGTYLLNKGNGTASTNTITFSLYKSDTENLSGCYYYQCKILDAGGEFDVVADGFININ